MPSNIDKELESWGTKHLNGKFMFEPMWLDARNELRQLINSTVLEVIDNLKNDAVSVIEHGADFNDMKQLFAIPVDSLELQRQSLQKMLGE